MNAVVASTDGAFTKSRTYSFDQQIQSLRRPGLGRRALRLAARFFAALDQPAPPTIFFAGPFLGFALNQAAQPTERHCVRILPFLLSRHSAPSSFLHHPDTPPTDLI
jgi:hypothetical protein